jgi:SAM-dependent methyltransferase
MPTGYLDTINQASYNEAYYLEPGYASPQNTFNFKAEQTIPRAQAIAAAGDILPGGRILDYGCGLGAMTIAFNRLGYDAMGLDPSECALTHALPEAREHIHPLGAASLSNLPNDTFDLAVAKDVFEHIPKAKIAALSHELMRVAQKLLLIIPIVGEDRKFIFDLYEQDPTHVTRLTREEWVNLFSRLHQSVLECPDLVSKVRRRDKVMGTVCILLTQLDNSHLIK